MGNIIFISIPDVLKRPWSEGSDFDNDNRVLSEGLKGRNLVTWPWPWRACWDSGSCFYLCFPAYRQCAAQLCSSTHTLMFCLAISPKEVGSRNKTTETVRQNKTFFLSIYYLRYFCCSTENLQWEYCMPVHTHAKFICICKTCIHNYL